MSHTLDSGITFGDFKLNQDVAAAIEKQGYQTPSPIQAETIPLILEGKDVLGQAVTGSGKTAAFGLPLLSKVDVSRDQPQVLILAPTRELAIQVSKALEAYGQFLGGLKVVPVYGGQSYDTQIRALKRNAQIVVGTPGRVMDLIEKGYLNLSGIEYFVLDEADEMLDMGFIDDIEWVIQRAPKQRQTILFSATMPSKIKKIASRYLNEPAIVRIQDKTNTASTISQYNIQVHRGQKLNILHRILGVESYDGVIVFVKTKMMTSQLSDALNQAGFKSVALSGEIQQKQREQTIQKFKKGMFDIMIATDVAARGLDIDRIDLVVNYDMPHNAATYIHRIGRTGRAGRQGRAIAFIGRSDHYLLRDIERTTKQNMIKMPIPTDQDLKAKQNEQLKQKISDAVEQNKHDGYMKVIEEYCMSQGISPAKAAAALASLVSGQTSLAPIQNPFEHESDRESRGDRRSRDRDNRGRRDRGDRGDRRDRARKGGHKLKNLDKTLKPYKINVGKQDGVTPRNIVGAIANELSISSKYLGAIKIYHDHSTVDMPSDLPKKSLQILSKTWIAGKQIEISKLS